MAGVHDWKFGEILWVKFGPLPYWPGRRAATTEASAEIKHLSREDFILIYFFGSHAFAWVQPAHIHRWDDNFEKFTDKNQTPLFKFALEEAYDWQKKAYTTVPTRTAHQNQTSDPPESLFGEIKAHQEALTALTKQQEWSRRYSSHNQGVLPLTVLVQSNTDVEADIDVGVEHKHPETGLPSQLTLENKPTIRPNIGHQIKREATIETSSAESVQSPPIITAESLALGVTQTPNPIQQPTILEEVDIGADLEPKKRKALAKIPGTPDATPPRKRAKRPALEGSASKKNEKPFQRLRNSEEKKRKPRSEDKAAKKSPRVATREVFQKENIKRRLHEVDFVGVEGEATKKAKTEEGSPPTPITPTTPIISTTPIIPTTPIILTTPIIPTAPIISTTSGPSAADQLEKMIAEAPLVLPTPENSPGTVIPPSPLPRPATKPRRLKRRDSDPNFDPSLVRTRRTKVKSPTKTKRVATIRGTAAEPEKETSPEIKPSNLVDAKITSPLIPEGSQTPTNLPKDTALGQSDLEAPVPLAGPQRETDNKLLPEKGREKRERRLRRHKDGPPDKGDTVGKKKKTHTPTKQSRYRSKPKTHSETPIKLVSQKAKREAEATRSEEGRAEAPSEIVRPINIGFLTPQKVKGEGSSQSTEDSPSKTLSRGMSPILMKKKKTKDACYAPPTPRGITKLRKKGDIPKVLAATPSPRRWPLSPKPEIAQRRVQMQRKCKNQNSLLKKKKAFDPHEESTPRRGLTQPAIPITQEPSNLNLFDDLDVGTEAPQQTPAQNWEARLTDKI